MKRQTFTLFLSCVVALVFLGCATTHHTTAYDYKIIKGRLGGRGSIFPPLEQQLEQAVAEGWDVVTAAVEETHPILILRRPK